MGSFNGGVLLCDVALAPTESVSNRAPNVELIALAEVFSFTQQTLNGAQAATTIEHIIY